MYNEFKIYSKSLLWFLISLIIILLIINTLYYFDLISNNLVKYFKLISILIPSFLSGLIRGFNSLNKGYLYGLKLSFIIIIVLFIISIILKEFNTLDLLYYLIISLTITFGSMIGINKRINN